MERRQVIKSLISVIIAAFVALFALLGSIGVLGWFSRSHSVTGGGMHIQTKDSSVLQILATLDGDNIGVEAITEEMETLENEKDGNSFRPSSSGQFKFYVRENDEGNSGQPYEFIYSISVENNEFHDENKGLYPGIGEDVLEQAKQYINSHIMFFTSKSDDGVYSGWICPDDPDPKRWTVNSTGPYEVTVYWIWIEQYKHIFTENNGLIEEEARKGIAEYYESHAEKMFFGGVKSSEAYNMADTIIGMTYQFICFQIKVTKV